MTNCIHGRLVEFKLNQAYQYDISLLSYFIFLRPDSYYLLI